jgi:hypothetical protein
MAQVVECLPGKHEALSSNSSMVKNQTKQNSKNVYNIHIVILYIYGAQWIFR